MSKKTLSEIHRTLNSILRNSPVNRERCKTNLYLGTFRYSSNPHGKRNIVLRCQKGLKDVIFSFQGKVIRGSCIRNHRKFKSETEDFHKRSKLIVKEVLNRQTRSMGQGFGHEV